MTDYSIMEREESRRQKQKLDAMTRGELYIKIIRLSLANRNLTEELVNIRQEKSDMEYKLFDLLEGVDKNVVKKITELEL